jgi:outer membrane protein
MQGTIPQSTGTAIPSYDPAVTGQLNWTHQTTPQTSIANYGTSTLVTGTTLYNAGIQQGFATGAQVGLNFNNSRTSLNSQRTGYNPYTASTFGLTATQPLLRGFGAGLNRRFIRIAGNERRSPACSSSSS